MIVSPSDVNKERSLIADVIQEWNNTNSFEKRIVILPLKWETHSAPELNRRPQDIINKEVVDLCDFAIGVFWSRIGSPTGQYDSGSTEEIDRIGNAGKVVMCYFSKERKSVNDIDVDQLKKLNEFKTKIYKNGLVYSYEDIVDFKESLRNHLDIKIKAIIESLRGSSDEFSIKPNLAFDLIGTNNYKNPKINVVNEGKDFLNEQSVEFWIGKPKKKTESTEVKSGSYFLDLVEYNRYYQTFKSFDIIIGNSGKTTIREIFVEIEFPDLSVLILRKNSPTFSPPTPSQKKSNFEWTTHSNILYNSYLPRLDSIPDNMSKNNSGFMDTHSVDTPIVNKTIENGKVKLSFDFPNIPPKSRFQISQLFYLGHKENVEIDIETKIFVNNFDEVFKFNSPYNMKAEMENVELSEMLERNDIYLK